ALVIAQTLEAAEEGASAVRASIAPTTALIPGKGRLEAPREGFWTVKGTKGDPQHGFEIAAKRIEHNYFQPTRNHNPMETSACVAQWTGDELTVWDSTQFNQNPRQVLAMAFGLPKEKVRVIAPHTGGVLGAKGFVWPHEVLAAQAAKIMGRPVRLQLTRA